jgi:hypothetical protein
MGIARRESWRGSDAGLGFAETLDAVAGFPLAAFFEQIDAFKTL